MKTTDVLKEIENIKNQPIRLPGLKPGVCSGLILSCVFCPDLKIGVWRRQTYQLIEKYKPEKIILFGSAAWGEANVKRFKEKSLLLTQKYSRKGDKNATNQI